MVKKVSSVDYMIQFAHDGKKKTVHCNDLQMDTCDQDKHNWIKNKLAHRLAQD